MEVSAPSTFPSPRLSESGHILMLYCKLANFEGSATLGPRRSFLNQKKCFIYVFYFIFFNQISAMIIAIWVISK